MSTLVMPATTELTGFRLYLIIRQIADMIHEMARKFDGGSGDKLSLYDARDSDVNPFFNQTEAGLFLEMYCGLPSYLWTPWGKWGFVNGSCSCGDMNHFNQAILDLLGATVFKKVEHNLMGTFGPVYAINSFEGISLPEPIVRKGELLSYKKCKRQWESMTRQFHNFRGTQPPMDVGTMFALDNDILKERGRREPKVGVHNIKDLKELRGYLGCVIKYSKDGGTTWHYAIVQKYGPERFSDHKLGFSIYSEVMPHARVHSRLSITADDFDAGIMVRPTTDEEIKKLTFSYDKKPLSK